MAVKGWFYAQLEGIQQAMGDSDDLVFLYEYEKPVARMPGLPTIDLEARYGKLRVGHSGIDEIWYTAAALGSALVGIRSIYWHDMYMANTYPFELITQHAGKLHHMTGGQATVPATFVIQLSGQAPGMAGQHSDYEDDSWYMHAAGIKTVIPSTPADAKGLMIAAVRSPDPVVYLNPAGLRTLVDDVPDEAYEVPIGKAAIRTEGTDITIVSSGPGMLEVMDATERLQAEGISVEAIDLRTLNPMDTETLVKSALKTGRMLTVDQSKYTLCPGAEVIARVAEGAPGTRFKRIAWPDAPPPGAPEMFNWMRPNQEHVYRAAKMLLG